MKLIFTLGMDRCFTDETEYTNQAWVIKIWDFKSLFMQAYEDEDRLSGGTIWSRSNANDNSN